MLFYFVFTTSIFMISFISWIIRLQNKQNDSFYNAGYLWIIAIILISIMGLRSFNVGKDTYSYYNIFRKFGMLPLFSEVSVNTAGYPIYRLICKIVYVVCGGSYNFFLFITAVITISCFLFFIKEISKDSIMSVLLFILYYMYFNSWNASRQYLAISIAIFGIVFLFKEKRLLFFITMICAILIHNSTAVLFVIYPLKYIKWNKRKIIIFGIVLLIGIVLVVKTLPTILLYIFPRYYQLYIYQWNTGDMRAFGGTAQGRKALVSVLFLLIIVLSFFASKAIEQGKGLVSDWILISLMLIEISIGIFLKNNSMILRIQTVFSPFIIVGIPNVIESMRFKRKIRALMKTALIGIMLIPYFVQLSENSAFIVPYQYLK